MVIIAVKIFSTSKGTQAVVKETPDAGTAIDQSIADTNDAEITPLDQGVGAENDDGVQPTVDASMDADAAVNLEHDAIVVVCGDGIVNGDEGCDDGNTDTEVCAYGAAECTVCAADCTEQAGATSSCGDGIVNGDEACDDGNADTEVCAYGAAECIVCAADCTEQAGLTSSCGDGVVNGDETCDDGNAETEICAYDADACEVCTANCTTGAGTLQFCGDGVVNGSEDCDDGNAETEACAYGDAECTVCAADCTEQAGVTSRCGDGVVNGNETCDDSNAVTETSSTTLTPKCVPHAKRAREFCSFVAMASQTGPKAVMTAMKTVAMAAVHGAQKNLMPSAVMVCWSPARGVTMAIFRAPMPVAAIANQHFVAMVLYSVLKSVMRDRIHLTGV